MSKGKGKGKGRETLKVTQLDVSVSSAARALQAFDASVDLELRTVSGEGAMGQPFQLAIVAAGAPVARQLCLFDDVEIGRAPGCGVCLEDASISRLHARIASGWLIDEGSANGLRVNGVPTKRHQLVDGDVIQLGSHELVFHRAIGSLPEAAPPPTPSDSGAGHFALGERTLRINREERTERELEVPSRAYLFMGGETKALVRRVLQVTVQRDEFLIGAAEGCDVRIKGFRAPRIAAALVRGPLGFTVLPFPSWRHNIELAGEQLRRPTPVEDGDVLGLNGLTMTFRVGTS